MSGNQDDKGKTALGEASASSKQNKKGRLIEKLRDKRDELTGSMEVVRKLNELSAKFVNAIENFNTQISELQGQQEQKREELKLTPIPTSTFNKFTREDLRHKIVDELTQDKLKAYKATTRVALTEDLLEKTLYKLQRIKTSCEDINPELSKLFKSVDTEFAKLSTLFAATRENSKAIREGVLVKLLNIIIKSCELIEEAIAILSGSSSKALEVVPLEELPRAEQIASLNEILKTKLELQKDMLNWQIKNVRAELWAYVKLLEEDIKQLEGRTAEEKLEKEERAKTSVQLVSAAISKALEGVEREKQEQKNKEDEERKTEESQEQLAQEKTEELNMKGLDANESKPLLVEKEKEILVIVKPSDSSPIQSHGLTEKLPVVTTGVREVNLAEGEKSPDEKLAKELEIHNQKLIFDEKAITTLPSREETGKLTNLLEWVTRKVSVLKQEATDQVANLHRQYIPYTTDTSSLIAKEIPESPLQAQGETESHNSTAVALPEAQRNEGNEADPVVTTELKHEAEEAVKPSSKVTEASVESTPEREGRQ